MYKDLGLAMEVAKVAGQNILPVGSTVHDLYGDLLQQGWVSSSPSPHSPPCRLGSKDFGVVYQCLSSESGLQSPIQREVEHLREENRFVNPCCPSCDLCLGDSKRSWPNSNTDRHALMRRRKQTETPLLINSPLPYLHLLSSLSRSESPIPSLPP